jgi:hypothetical protein
MSGSSGKDASFSHLLAHPLTPKIFWLRKAIDLQPGNG